MMEEAALSERCFREIGSALSAVMLSQSFLSTLILHDSINLCVVNVIDHESPHSEEITDINFFTKTPRKIAGF
jgi:hypothetical protein